MDEAHEMAEEVVYADICFPPPAPTAALLGLGLHWAVGSCATKLRSMEQGLENKTQQPERLLAGRCQFCPAGWLWHSGKCYYFSSARRDWDRSKEDCCSRGAQLVTIRANATLAFLQRASNHETFHIGLKRASPRVSWKWVDGSALNRLFPVAHHTTSYLSCGRVSGQGLSSGQCTKHWHWICEQSALTLQWGHSSALPTFLWGNTTYACAEPNETG